ncbi:MAG: AraC family transcriptional regulator [Gillisia sp.]
MNKDKVFIKNMVCPRCLTAVEAILNSLEISFDEISLGEVSLSKPLNVQQSTKLNLALEKVGFELIAEKNKRLSNQVKSIIITGIYEDRTFHHRNLSDILSEQLHSDYSHLSSVFSKTEGKSIKKFQQEIKSERVKELLEYDELNISQIALDLGYSSAAYLSTQFKKSTGFTPSQFKLDQVKKRNSLDSH